MTPRRDQLSERDRLVLEALAELRLAVLPQVAAWLGVTEGTAARRLRRLAGDGLIDYEPVFTRGAAMARITGPGLKRIDSTMGRPGLKLDEYRHDVGVSWLWAAAHEGVFGEMATVLSERRMRSHDARLEQMTPGARALADDGRFRGVGRIATSDGRERRHYPDLLMITPQGREVAVELELSHKGSRRLEEVMSAYVSDPRIDAVLYLVPDERLARAVQQAAQRAGAGRLVHVRRLAPGQVVGVGPALARGAETGRRRTPGRGAEAGQTLARGRGPARAAVRTGSGWGRG